MAVINDKEMLECIIDDLIAYRGHTEEQATKWAKENGEIVVDAMWEEYTNELEKSCYYEEEEDDAK